MSLADDSKLIIPNTVGVLTAAVKEANEADKQELVEYIRNMQKINYIIEGRVAGVPLDNLVPEGRIAQKPEEQRISEKGIHKGGLYDSLGLGDRD